MPTYQHIHRRNELNRQACEFLSDCLAGGPRAFSSIRQLGAKQGVSLSTLLTAKHSLHVEVRTVDRRAIWHLPATA